MRFGDLLRVMRLGDLLGVLRGLDFFSEFSKVAFVCRFVESNEDYLRNTSIWLVIGVKFEKPKCLLAIFINFSIYWSAFHMIWLRKKRNKVLFMFFSSITI